MASILRAGVIGAGVFGGFHAGQYARRPDIELTAILDPHPERAQALAERYGARAAPDLSALLARVDLLTIASPAHTHAALTLAALADGKHIYVEKPIATSLEDADAIVAAAGRGGPVVACGFLERAAFQAMNLFEIDEAPLRLEAVRRGPPSPRSLDVSVVIDLMIHDLDLALVLSKVPALAVEARGTRVVNRLLDEVEAEVTFEDGFTALLSASRVAEARERTMRLIYPTGEVTIDFLAHTFENTTAFRLDATFEETPAGRDRLGASLDAFLAAVRGEASGPLADAEAGAKALDLALAVEQAAEG
ncbi:MAG: Gfo/Idh/MocA family oxidoreductase [Caulobacteraceae bacterium]